MDISQKASISLVYNACPISSKATDRTSPAKTFSVLRNAYLCLVKFFRKIEISKTLPFSSFLLHLHSPVGITNAITFKPDISCFFLYQYLTSSKKPDSFSIVKSAFRWNGERTYEMITDITSPLEFLFVFYPQQLQLCSLPKHREPSPL